LWDFRAAPCSLIRAFSFWSSDKMEDFGDYGINVPNGSGNRKLRCPNCQATRTKNKNDKPLSVDLTKGLWKCHHCGDKGIVKDEKYQAYSDLRSKARYSTPLKRVYKACVYTPKPEAVPPDALMTYFQKRGISEAVVKRNQVEVREVFMPQMNRRVSALAFPFKRDGEVINVKYRDQFKNFRMESECEPIFYGLDDIKAGEPVIIVEGEFDKLSLEECGLGGVISVPNGTGTALNAALESVEPFFRDVTKFILAGDMDDAGKRMTKELYARLGPERCWLVEWPEGCKDANDTLVQRGGDAVRDSIAHARAVPLAGVYEVSSLRESIWDLYDLGIPQGVAPGWTNLTELYRPRLGECTYLTGIPGMGKSAFMSALAVNIAEVHNWKFMIFPAEALPLQQFASELIAIWSGHPFEDMADAPRMSMEMLNDGMDWLEEHFILMNPEDNDKTVDGILALAKQQIYRQGINALVIDPWNEISHGLADGQSEVSYLNEKLGKIRQFARTHQIHVWIVAHPTKLFPAEGQFPAPTIYDLAGGAAWANKADAIIAVHRDKNDSYGAASILVQKIRFRHGGRLGKCQLYFDVRTGRYSEAPPIQLVVKKTSGH
jgi:twinkle protein